MYKIFTTNLKYQFSLVPPIKLSRLVDRKLKQISTFQKSSYNQISQIFLKLYILQNKQNHQLTNHIRVLQTQCLASSKPVQNILQYFQMTSQKFNQKYLVQVFINLVKAIKISQIDNSLSFDHGPNNKLFYTPAFDHLIQQFKYGLKQNVFISWEGMTKIINCLVEIGYVDAQIIDLLIQKISIRLGLVNISDGYKSVDNHQFRLFQGQKQNYYEKSFHIAYQQLMDNDKLKLAYQHLKQRTLNKKVKDLQGIDLQQHVSSQESKKIIKSLLDVINNMNNNVETMVQAIIAIRQQYRRMCKGSNLKLVLQDYNLNDALLQIEQELLSIGLIDVNDIKVMHNMITDQFQINQLNYFSFQDQKKKVQQILIKLLKNDQTIPAISAFLENQEDQYQFNQLKKQNQTNLKNKHIEQLSAAINSLVKLANAPYYLKKSREGISLLSRQLQNNIMRGNDSISQFLPVERIFRKTYSQIQSFLKQNLQITEFVTMNFHCCKKILWVESLFNIGLYDKGFKIMSSIMKLDSLSKQIEEQFKVEQVFSFINCLNYCNGLLMSQQLKSSLFSYLNSLFSIQNENQVSQKWHISNQNLCGVIDFLYINYSTRQDKQIQKIYQTLVNELAQRVQSLKFNKTSNSSHEKYDFFVKAFRILSFQKPAQYQFTNFLSFYDNFQQKEINKYPYDSPYPELRQSTGSSKFLSKNMRNPYKQVIINTIHQYTKQNNQDSQIIILGYGSSSGKTTLNGIYICDSTQSSLDGKNVNGSLKAYLARMKQFYNLQIKPISTNEFLNINYSQKDQMKAIKVKNPNEIKTILQNIYSQSNQDWKLVSSFMNAFMISAAQISNNFEQKKLNIKLKNCLLQMKQILNLIQNSTIVYQHYLAQRTKIVVLLNKIKNDLKQNKQILSKINQSFQKKQLKGSIEQDIELMINHFSANLDALRVKNTSIFQGKRMSVQLVNANEVKNNIRNGLELELIDYQNWLDKTFANYNQWYKRLIQNTHFQQILIDKMDTQTKLLAKAFCPNIRERMSLIPQFKNPADYKLMSYHNTYHPYNWQAIYTKKWSQQQIQYKQNIKSIAETSINNSQAHYQKGGISNHIKKIIKILTFSHELKVNKNLQEIYQYILGFEFINNLLYAANQGQKAIPVLRNGQNYFEYLQSKYQKIYLQSPYMEYILEKMNNTQQVKDLLQKRKDLMIKNKALYQRGQISRQSYKASIKKVEKQIIDKMQENIKNKVLDHSEDIITQPSLKMVELEKNINQFKRLFQKANNYSRWLDEDFIEADGDYSKALMLKRVKAEQNLIKLKIISKLINQQSLSQLQKNFVKKWKNNDPSLTHANYNDKTLNKLSQNDKNRLQLIHSNISLESSFIVSDLVLQLDHFIDRDLIKTIDRNLYLLNNKNISSIPSEVFQFSSNKEFSVMTYQKQQQIFKQNSKITDTQIQEIIQMISTLKLQSPFLRKRFNQLKPIVKRNIHQMNNIPSCRNQLVTEYSKRINIQFDAEYQPIHVKQMKDQEGQKMWKSVFNKKYNQVSVSEIAFKVSQLCTRFYLLNKSVPPFFAQFVLMILKHPNTDIMTKQKLIVHLEVFKIPLVLDSQDLIGISQYCNRNKVGTQSYTLSNNTSLIGIMDRMRIVSQKNFGKRVAQLL